MMKGTVSSAGGPLSDTAKMKEPKMVVCALCSLLVGWSEADVKMVCIPCFDQVRITPTGTVSLGDCLQSRNHLTMTDDAGHCIYCGRDF